MTHPSEETLNDYIERELSPAEQVRVATHLETCARMRARRCRDSTGRARGGGARPARAAAACVDVDSGHGSGVESRESRVESRQSPRVRQSRVQLESPEPRTQSPTGPDSHGRWQRPRSSSWRFSRDGFSIMREQQDALAARREPRDRRTGESPTTRRSASACC